MYVYACACSLGAACPLATPIIEMGQCPRQKVGLNQRIISSHIETSSETDTKSQKYYIPYQNILYFVVNPICRIYPSLLKPGAFLFSATNDDSSRTHLA